MDDRDIYPGSCCLSRQVAEVFIKESVQPILNEYAFGIIQKITLESIRFGDKAPQITGTCCSVLFYGVDDLTGDEKKYALIS